MGNGSFGIVTSVRPPGVLRGGSVGGVPSLLTKSSSSAREGKLPRGGRNDPERGLGNGSFGIVTALRPTGVLRGGGVGGVPSLRGVPESSSGCCCCGLAGREEAARCTIGSPSDPKSPAGLRRMARDGQTDGVCESPRACDTVAGLV